MASSPSGGVFSACLLLVCGAPGSGKTLLAETLAEFGGRTHPGWHWVAVHFDHFYPADMRIKQSAEAPAMFDLKQARSVIRRNLEVLISRTVTPRDDLPSLDDDDDGSVVNFVRHINTHSRIFEDNGRYMCGSEEVVFILDDNMHVRSMRHEYYQLARSYNIGFVEVFLSCPLSVALARNSRRSLPIPDATIIAMDQSMELPRPAVHHWEKQSIVIENSTDHRDCLVQQCEDLVKLVEEAIHNPVPPLPQVDTELQQKCRAVNMENLVHQADHILRKCVADAVKHAPQSTQKSTVAKEANMTRKKFLEDIRGGVVRSGSGETWDCSQDLDHMATVLNNAFKHSMDTFNKW